MAEARRIRRERLQQDIREAEATARALRDELHVLDRELVGLGELDVPSNYFQDSFRPSSTSSSFMDTSDDHDDWDYLHVDDPAARALYHQLHQINRPSVESHEHYQDKWTILNQCLVEDRIDDFVLLAWFDPQFAKVRIRDEFESEYLEAPEVAPSPPTDDASYNEHPFFHGKLVLIDDGYFVRMFLYTHATSVDVQRLCMAIAKADLSTVRGIVHGIVAEERRWELLNNNGVIEMLTDVHHCAITGGTIHSTVAVSGTPLQFALCYENDEILRILYAAGAATEFDVEVESTAPIDENNPKSKVCTPLWVEARNTSLLAPSHPDYYRHREIFQSVGHVIQSESVKRSWLAYNMAKPTDPLRTDDALKKTPRKFRERARTCMLVLARLHIHLPPNVKTTLLEHLYATDVFGIVDTQDVLIAASLRDRSG
ncbi:hypothetical protein RI054_37g140870 [Pseudoscourfieldia marina]